MYFKSVESPAPPYLTPRKKNVGILGGMPRGIPGGILGRDPGGILGRDPGGIPPGIPLGIRNPSI